MKIHPLWYICVIFRLLFSIIVYENIISVDVIKYVLLCISLGFFYRSFTGSNNEIQFSRVFWHEVRIFHGVIFLLATIFSFYGKYGYSGFLILLDIIFSMSYRIIRNI